MCNSGFSKHLNIHYLLIFNMLFVIVFPQKLNVAISYDSMITVFGIYLENTKIHKKYVHIYFCSAKYNSPDKKSKSQ